MDRHGTNFFMVTAVHSKTWRDIDMDRQAEENLQIMTLLLHAITYRNPEHNAVLNTG